MRALHAEAAAAERHDEGQHDLGIIGAGLIQLPGEAQHEARAADQVDLVVQAEVSLVRSIVVHGIADTELQAQMLVGQPGGICGLDAAGSLRGHQQVVSNPHVSARVYLRTGPDIEVAGIVLIGDRRPVAIRAVRVASSDPHRQNALRQAYAHGGTRIHQTVFRLEPIARRDLIAEAVVLAREQHGAAGKIAVGER